MKRLLLVTFSTFALVALVNPYPSFAQNQPPVADAGPDQSIWVNQYTGLQGSAYDPNNNPIVDWLWTVEISPPGSSPFLPEPNTPDPAFRVDMAGDYILSLKASDGAAWSEPDSVTIHAIELLPPVAIITTDLVSGIAPLTVQFDASQSYHPNIDQGIEIRAYVWNFGDGSLISDEISPLHTYQFRGSYTARLTVFDTLDQISVAEIDITVLDPVTAQLSTWGQVKALYQ